MAVFIHVDIQEAGQMSIICTIANITIIDGFQVYK